MRKLLLPVALLLAMCSCTKETTTSEEFVPLDTIVCTRTVTLNNETKAGVLKPVDLTLTTEYNVNDNCVRTFSISCEDSDVDVNGMREMVKEQFEAEYGFPLENSDLNMIMEASVSDDPSSNPTKDCFMDCQSKKKGEGRGWCRAGCILDLIIRILEPISKLIK